MASQLEDLTSISSPMVLTRYRPRSTEQPTLRVCPISRPLPMGFLSHLSQSSLRRTGLQTQIFLPEHQTAKHTILGDRVSTLQSWATVSFSGPGSLTCLEVADFEPRCSFERPRSYPYQRLRLFTPLEFPSLHLDQLQYLRRHSYKAHS